LKEDLFVSRRHFGTFVLVLATVLPWHRAAQAQPMMACAADRGRLCPDTPLGGGRVAECLLAHETELSTGCRQALGVAARKDAGPADGAPANAAPADDGVKSECRSDAIKYCRAAIGDKPRMKTCMQQHAAQLSDGCKTALIAHGD
jgi:hypothetical protein